MIRPALVKFRTLKENSGILIRDVEKVRLTYWPNKHRKKKEKKDKGGGEKTKTGFLHQTISSPFFPRLSNWLEC
jgi:hypothetical protein